MILNPSILTPPPPSQLDKCIASGANIVLSKLPIGDLATQYFADKGLFCAGRVEVGDIVRVAKATGGQVQTSTNGLSASILGQCGHFEEKRVGDERFNLFTECPSEHTATIVLRGGSEQFIEESHRSIHDAIMVVKRSLKSCAVVAGGGGETKKELGRSEAQRRAFHLYLLPPPILVPPPPPQLLRWKSASSSVKRV